LKVLIRVRKNTIEQQKFSNFSTIARWRGSIGSKNREYYSKNNDKGKFFFAKI